MNHPERLIVRAMIPSADNPDAHILHVTGTLPAESAPLQRTVESVLHAIGNSALQQGYLSIDMLERRNVAVPHSSVVVNVTEILTKPLNRKNIQLNDEYRWSDE